jgi:cytochrome c-type biogenesis protein
MHRYITLTLLVGFLAFSCGSKDDTTATNNNTKPNTLQQKTPNNNSSQQTNQQTNTPAGYYYSISSVGSSAGAKGFIDFTWNQDSKEKKLSDYKGKVILLNFWATWCPPCRKELPDLSEIAKEFKGKNFELIGISVDENPVALVNFLKSNSLSYTVLHEKGGLLDKYMDVAGGNQNVIPQTFIIDKNGKVVENIIGSRNKEDFVSIINKYL